MQIYIIHAAFHKVGAEPKNFDGPVDIEVANLPEGVKLKEAKVQLVKGTNDIEVVLMADEKAKVLSNHSAKVTASSGDVSVSETVKISVQQKE